MSGSDTGIVLYDYWRSSASYRVRIALGLLGLEWTAEPVNLLTAAHRSEAYREINPQGLVPSLAIDGKTLTQSLAIIEYLNATVPGASLLPADAEGQYRVRRLSYAVAMEVHPVCNLAVAQHVVALTDGGDAARQAWMQHFIAPGLEALEAMLAETPGDRFCHGDQPTMADCCLIPQLYNAERWGVPYDHLPRVSSVAKACASLPAFQNAHPDAVGPPPS